MTSYYDLEIHAMYRQEEVRRQVQRAALLRQLEPRGETPHSADPPKAARLWLGGRLAGLGRKLLSLPSDVQATSGCRC